MTLAGRLLCMPVQLLHGMNGCQQCVWSAFEASSVIGERRNVDVVELLPRRCTGRRHVVTSSENKRGQSVVSVTCNGASHGAE